MFVQIWPHIFGRDPGRQPPQTCYVWTMFSLILGEARREGVKRLRRLLSSWAQAGAWLDSLYLDICSCLWHTTFRQYTQNTSADLGDPNALPIWKVPLYLNVSYIFFVCVVIFPRVFFTSVFESWRLWCFCVHRSELYWVVWYNSFHHPEHSWFKPTREALFFTVNSTLKLTSGLWKSLSLGHNPCLVYQTIPGL